MQRRNTIQKNLILQAVQVLHGHVTADEVYEELINNNPYISKATVYRNLNILAEEGKILKIEVPNGADKFDHTCKDHFHMQCVNCNKLFDIEVNSLPDLTKNITNDFGMTILDYSISFSGICPKCQKIIGEKNE